MNLLDNFDVKNISNLDLMASQVVEGFIIGLHKSPFHGFSVEFAEHRLYNQGESTKNIDWKVFARTDKMFTKKFEEETNLRCQIVIDISSSMYFPEANNNKLRFAALGAAALMNLLKKQRDAFGLSLFDENISLHTQCKSSLSHYRLLLTYLENVIQNYQKDKKTATSKALHEIADRLHRRSLVIIFSDMFDNSDDADEMMSALQHLKYNKHEVILFHVTDKSKELNFEYENRPYLFIDMETGEQVRVQSNQIKEQYVKQIQQFKYDLQLKCLQYKIDFVEADISEGYRQILQQYLVKRSKLL
ncbi:MAG: DUF58 domain-containing protein [Saprospiraceae bacterium]|nr:DUF58 domain-containing protein [Saprospiraceae bacterium]